MSSLDAGCSTEIHLKLANLQLDLVLNVPYIIPDVSPLSWPLFQTN